MTVHCIYKLITGGTACTRLIEDQASQNPNNRHSSRYERRGYKALLSVGGYLNDVVTFLQTCGPSEPTHAPGDVLIARLKQVALNGLSEY